jgi:TRAP-type C4-dicarboxylate transport system permease small subunit
MGGLLWVTEKLCKGLNVIAGIALTFIMLLTVADVGLRLFGRPIVGTFELVGFGGAVAIGFGIPITSWMRGHIFVDFFVGKFPKGAAAAMNIFTRLLGIGIFLLTGWNLFLLAGELLSSGEVSLTRHIPFYPIAYGLAVCCLLQCLVLITDIIKIFGGKYE